jgi:hypothetical protein
LDFVKTPWDFSLFESPDRFQNSASLPWSVNRLYQHPGWHYFLNVSTAPSISDPVTARFDVLRMLDGPVAMDVHMNAAPQRDYSKALSPRSRNAASAYVSSLLPTLVVRQEGDAWELPFAFVYESYTASEGPSITSVDQIVEEGVFKGLRVESAVNGERIRQYILNLEASGSTYENADLGIRFTGHFGVVTTNPEGELLSLYIGEGDSLAYGNAVLTADPLTKAAYRAAETSAEQWKEFSDSLGWVEYSKYPYIFSIELSGWLYHPYDNIDGQNEPWFYIFK